MRVPYFYEFYSQGPYQDLTVESREKKYPHASGMERGERDHFEKLIVLSMMEMIE